MRKVVYVCLFLLPLQLLAQKDLTTFGIQLKPLVPNSYFNFSSESVLSDDGVLEATWEPKPSLCFGMVIRHGFTDFFSVETGINLIRRNYEVIGRDEEEGVSGATRFAFTGYEIPLQGLIYVRLGEEWWMNGAGGMSIDMYPSSTFASSAVQGDTTFYDFAVTTVKRRWVQMSLLANLGFEYRHKKKGSFYIGATYHRPFNDMAISQLNYQNTSQVHRANLALNGNYFTIDFRYFFHEKSRRR